MLMSKKRKNKFIANLKKWKTSKTTLFIAIWMCTIYTVVNCIFGIVNTKYGSVFYFDSTQTSEWFEFWKWVVISGGAITVTKIAKTKNNNDMEEPKG